MEFKKIELTDKPVFDKYYKKYPQHSEYLSFTTLFTWQAYVKFMYAVLDGHIVIKFENYKNKKVYILIPETDSSVLKELIPRLDREGYKSFSNLTKKQTEDIEMLFPGQYTFSHKRDSDNYIYLSEKMASLSGKKLHSKKNFVNRFKKENEYSYEKITEANIPECLEVLNAWCEKKECSGESVSAESCACTLAIKNMEALSLKGGAIRVNGKIVAFTLGEKVADDMAVIHFEKADYNYKGAFQTIFMEFVKNEWMDVTFINREEDTGDEGLRKAKLSYCPEYLLEMYDGSKI